MAIETCEGCGGEITNGTVRNPRTPTPWRHVNRADWVGNAHPAKPKETK